jgi:hypothetical protein
MIKIIYIYNLRTPLYAIIYLLDFYFSDRTNFIEREFKMDDIIKLRELISNGYWIQEIKVDAAGNGVINMMFSGNGSPVEGQYYFLITTDEAVITKAREIHGNK